MPDLAEATSGVPLDQKVEASPILALANVVTPAPQASGSVTSGFLDKAKGLFSNASSSASATAARVSSTASENAGLMWILLAAMVAAGFFIFSAGGKKGGKKSIFKLGGGRKPSGGSFAR